MVVHKPSSTNVASAVDNEDADFLVAQERSSMMEDCCDASSLDDNEVSISDTIGLDECFTIADCFKRKGTRWVIVFVSMNNKIQSTNYLRYFFSAV